VASSRCRRIVGIALYSVALVNAVLVIECAAFTHGAKVVATLPSLLALLARSSKHVDAVGSLGCMVLNFGLSFWLLP
jgi:hypothetical protein